jgi:hypothetical protein
MDGVESGGYTTGVNVVDLRESSLLDRDALSENALLLLHVTGYLLERVALTCFRIRIWTESCTETLEESIKHAQRT